MSPSPIPLDTRVTIGAFARVTRISARTLRKYDALGIIRPTFVDPDTGYRYYTMRQYPLAETIRMLRSLDVPLGEVRAILQADRDAGRRLLERHLTRVNERIDRERRTVTRLESALAHGGAVRAYHCELREVAARPVISLTISSPRTGIDAAIAARPGLAHRPRCRQRAHRHRARDRRLRLRPLQGRRLQGRRLPAARGRGRLRRRPRPRPRPPGLHCRRDRPPRARRRPAERLCEPPRLDRRARSRDRRTRARDLPGRRARHRRPPPARDRDHVAGRGAGTDDARPPVRSPALSV